MANEYAREIRWTRNTKVDPFVFGLENEKKNHAEIELNSPDPKLRIEAQVQYEIGLG